MLNAEQIQYLLAGTTGGTHDGETFTGNIHLVEKVGLQIRDLQNGGYMEKADAIAFLVGSDMTRLGRAPMTCGKCKRPVTYLSGGGRGVRYHVHSGRRECDFSSLSGTVIIQGAFFTDSEGVTHTIDLT